MSKDSNISKDTPKKRKKESSDSSSKVSHILHPAISSDVYKDTIEYEEEESLKQDPNKELEFFCATCEELRKLMAEISLLKNANSPQASAQIVEKRIKGSLLFVTLKKLNRLEKFRTNNLREKLHKAKQQVDSCDLQLQNLLYEAFHVRKEVTKCLQFKSKAEEIDLVPEDEFYKEAPETISRPSVTRADTHQLKLARLEWELKQRKELAVLCHDLLGEKEKVATENYKKQNQLENLSPMLKDILKVANPVQEVLGLTTGVSTSQQRAALLLPHPLYFLFVQADALREAGDKCISIKIEGEEEEAQSLKEVVPEAITPDDSDSDTQEEVLDKRHSRRKKSRMDQREERRKQLTMTHPLSVTLVISLKDDLASITLQFSYLVQLHVVTVRTKVKLSPSVTINPDSYVSKLVDSEHILCELFPEDFGESSPNTANIYQLQQLGIDSFNSLNLGLAYVWVQRVAGLNFSSKRGGATDVPADIQLSQTSLPTTVAAIKKRLRARIALCTQLQSLEAKMLPDIPEVRVHFHPNLVSELTLWQPLTWTEYLSLNFTHEMIALGSVSSNDILYKGTLVRGSARLVMAVAIKNCYPLLPPVFVLQAAYEDKTIQAANNDSIRDIEREVNVYVKELMQQTKCGLNLLMAQILRVMTNFDILLEASSNQDFKREKLFIQSNRGRNRAWPFKQSVLGEGTFHFTQR